MASGFCGCTELGSLLGRRDLFNIVLVGGILENVVTDESIILI